jgi:hypothetical protein
LLSDGPRLEQSGQIISSFSLKVLRTGDQVGKFNKGLCESRTRVLAEAAWAPLLVFGIHVLAFVFNAYENHPLVDVPMHFFGGVAIAFFFHRLLVSDASPVNMMRRFQGITYPTFVLTATCTAAVFWDCAEFLVDWWFGTRFLGGVNDTIGDLFWGVVGGLFFIFSSAFLTRSRPLSSNWSAE